MGGVGPAFYLEALYEAKGKTFKKDFCRLSCFGAWMTILDVRDVRKALEVGTGFQDTVTWYDSSHLKDDD